MMRRGPWLWMVFAALVALAPGWMAGNANAGAATNIRGDSSFGASGKSIVTPKGSIYTISGGMLVGSNLFESFSDFSLAVKATAVWTYLGHEPMSGIENVINRITGGRVSDIDGKLKLDPKTLPHAAFYFINPAGILFGKGASVDVPGAAYFSTAKQLIFGGGAVLTASTATGSTLSMAQPAAFGFLGPQRNITMTGGAKVAGAGQVFLAADALKLSDATLKAGSLDLIAVGNQAQQVSIADPLAGPASGGDITISEKSTLETFKSPGVSGSIELDGRNVTLSGSASYGLESQGGAIEVTADALTMNGGKIEAVSDSARRGGDITIDARSITLNHPASIATETFDSGRAGDIFINDVGGLVEAGARILSFVQKGALGRGGDVRVNVRTIALSHNALLGSRTSGAGAGGEVNVTAIGRLSSDDGKIFSTVFTGDSTGSGGNVEVKADDISLVDGSVIVSDTFGNGRAGNVTVYVNHDLLINDAVISGDTQSRGLGSDIIVKATNISVEGCGRVQTCPIRNCGETRCPLTCGSSICDCGDYSCGKISASAFSGGNAGDISVTAQRLVIGTGGVVSSNTGNTQSPNATGNGGAVGIAVGTLIVRGGGGVESDGIGFGQGGELDIHADLIRVQDSLGCELTTCSKISASALGNGNAGEVSLTTNSLVVRGYGAVETNAGQIDPSTGEAMGGSGNAGQIAIDAETIAVQSGGSIESGTLDSGRGGNVSIEAQTIAVQDSKGCTSSLCAQISASTSANGDAGKLFLSANAITVRGGGEISASTGLFPSVTGEVALPTATGNAGLILVDSQALSLESGGSISSDTWDRGNAGSVALNISGEFIVNDASVSVAPLQTSRGEAGAIIVRAGPVIITDGGSISTGSSNAMPAGGVAMDVEGLLIDGLGSVVSSANTGHHGGAAGPVNIETGPITISNGGAVTTNSVSGAAGPVSITVVNGADLFITGAHYLGQIDTSSETGTGGEITITGPSAIVVNGGIIAALGTHYSSLLHVTAGAVVVSADRPNDVAASTNVTPITVPLNVTLVDASKVLTGQCPALRARGETSQFGAAINGPYPWVPIDLPDMSGPGAAVDMAPAPTSMGCGGSAMGLP